MDFKFDMHVYIYDSADLNYSKWKSGSLVN